ncbi:MAG: hypothetical protein LRY35_06420 [Clostridiales bacterium]|nr:hypothetical protein [Clostridiales bacterium]
MTEKERAAAIVAALEQRYPDALCTLDYRTAHELLVGAILAAQCTDYPGQSYHPRPCLNGTRPHRLLLSRSAWNWKT